MQTFGTAMGSPLSPILSDIVTEQLLETATRSAGIPQTQVKKYVDDLFLVLDNDQVDKVLGIFNSYNEHLQFTCEREKDGKLPFLDVLVVRQNDNTLHTDWYAKPISSGRLLNYHSMHPMYQKISLASNLITRIRTLSTVRNSEEKNQLITDLLRKNDYPITLIHRLLHQPTHTPSFTTPHPTSVEPIQYRSIPLIPELTPTIKAIVRKFMPNISIAANNRHNVKQLYNTAKDSIPDGQKSNVIYKIGCLNCNSYYIGMTTNRVQVRMYGHNTHINALERELQTGHSYDDEVIQKMREKTALVDHCITQQHRFDLKQPSIIDRTYRPQTLPVLEMCHIYTSSNTVNRRTDTDGLSCAYANLLSSIASLKERRVVERNTAVQQNSITANLDTNT